MTNNIIVLDGMAEQASPAATDIKKAIARLKTKFTADHVKLVLLGLFQILCPGSEITTGILHFRIQKEIIEIVGEVVMELDKGFFITGRLTAAGIIPLKLVVEARLDFFSEQKGESLSEKIAFIKSFFELTGTHPFGS